MLFLYPSQAIRLEILCLPDLIRAGAGDRRNGRDYYPHLHGFDLRARDCAQVTVLRRTGHGPSRIEVGRCTLYVPQGVGAHGGSYRVLHAVVIATVLAGNVLTQPVGQRTSGNTSPARSQSKPGEDAPPAIPVAVKDDIRRIAAALEAGNKKQPSEIDERNARAQEQVAGWTPPIFLAALGEMLVTAAGVYLVWKTLIASRDAAGQARRAADAAEQTLKESQKNAALELRAYLSVEPLGIRLLASSNDCLGQRDAH